MSHGLPLFSLGRPSSLKADHALRVLAASTQPILHVEPASGACQKLIASLSAAHFKQEPFKQVFGPAPCELPPPSPQSITHRVLTECGCPGRSSAPAMPLRRSLSMQNMRSMARRKARSLEKGRRKSMDMPALRRALAEGRLAAGEEGGRGDPGSDVGSADDIFRCARVEQLRLGGRRSCAAAQNFSKSVAPESHVAAVQSQ